MPTFQICGIDPAPFQPLFALDDQQLAAHGAVRRIATADFGFPCRVSLDDASVGEELLLIPYEHHATASPYRASGPIFVRRGALQKRLGAGEIPPYLSRRLLSLRTYDREHLMVAATVCAGSAVAEELQRAFLDPVVEYIHLHNAKPGCFACRVDRA